MATKPRLTQKSSIIGYIVAGGISAVFCWLIFIQNGEYKQSSRINAVLGGLPLGDFFVNVLMTITVWVIFTAILYGLGVVFAELWRHRNDVEYRELPVLLLFFTVFMPIISLATVVYLIIQFFCHNKAVVTALSALTAGMPEMDSMILLFCGFSALLLAVLFFAGLRSSEKNFSPARRGMFLYLSTVCSVISLVWAMVITL